MATAERWGAIAAWTAFLLLGLVHLYMAIELPGGPDGMSDLAVYRLAGEALLAGQDPYQVSSPLNGDRFTYPPFAALLLAPLALVPEPTARLAWTAFSWLLVLVLAAAVHRRSSLPTIQRMPAQLGAPVLACLLLISYPVFTGLFLGQISLLITVLMLLDALDLTPRRLQGLGVGLAAGLKLTPLVLVPLLLWTGRRRAAAFAVTTFAATLVVGWLVLPESSAAYWWTVRVVPDFIPVDQLDNQSIRGLLERRGSSGEPTTMIVLMMITLAMLAYGAGSDLYRDGRVLESAVIVGALGVLLSPISWSHHQTVLVVAAFCAVSPHRGRALAWSLFAYLIMLLPWPFLLRPGSLGYQLLGELPFVLTLLIVAVPGVRLLPARARMFGAR